MVDVRTALLKRFQWFTHLTPLNNFTSIRAGGLSTQERYRPRADVLQQILKEIGHGRSLCLHPVGAALCPDPIDDPPYMKLAICGDNLSDRVGLDWSYSWEIVENRMQGYAANYAAEFAVGIAEQFGSIVCYDAVKASRLRVLCQGNGHDDPSSWRSLEEMQQTTGDVVLFDIGEPLYAP